MYNTSMKNNFEILAAFEERVEAVGSDATQSQCDRLVDWVICNVPQDLWGTAAETVLLMDGPDSVYADLRQRISEMGI